MPQTTPRAATPGVRRPVTAQVSLICVGAVLLLMQAACTSKAPSPANSPQPASTSAAPSEPVGTTPYLLLAADFHTESGLRTEIDPMMFVSAPGTPAGVGPLHVPHIANVAPADSAAPATTPLLGGDGKPLGITLGQWTTAKGTAAFSCINGKERATSMLTGLLPSATYSTFVVNTAFDGPRRFTPWGDPAGTTNNFTASATGTASRTDVVDGCRESGSVIAIIWHSDGTSHGASPGSIGATWHTSLITPMP